MPFRIPGAAARAIRAGANLAPEQAVGRRTWEEFLAEWASSSASAVRRAVGKAAAAEALTNLYVWLRFFHLFGLAAFLFAHGVSGGVSIALRSSVSSDSRRLLWLSQRSNRISDPALLVVIVTGLWRAFAGHWWGKGWLWASLLVLVAVLVAMGLIARQYYMARKAAVQPDDVLADRLSHTRPLAAVWIGAVGLLLLIFLMVLKPF